MTSSHLIDVDDIVGYIALLLGEEHILPFARTCKIFYGVSVKHFGIVLQSKSSLYCSSIALTRWALAYGCTFGPNMFNLIQYAAAGGHVTVLKWASDYLIATTSSLTSSEYYEWRQREVNIRASNQPSSSRIGGSRSSNWRRLSKSSIVNFFRRGSSGSQQNLPLFHWDHETRVFTAAAGAGHLHVLQWLKDQRQNTGTGWNFSTIAAAAGAGHLSVLKWLRSQEPPCRWEVSACRQAARYGHIHVLEWMLLQPDPAPIDSTVYDAAAAGGHIHIIEWLTTSGADPQCALHIRTSCACELAAGDGDISTFMWLRNHTPAFPCYPIVLAKAAANGHLSIIQWSITNSPVDALPWSEIVCSAAAKHGHLQILQWLRYPQLPGVGPCRWDARVCSYAAQEGHLHIIRWAREEGCPWDEKATTAAIVAGRLDVLQYLRYSSPPCPWLEKYVCYNATKHNRLAILKWARSLEPTPCHWNEALCEVAAEYGYLDILMWARSQDPPCPWQTERTCWAAAKAGQLEVLQWIKAVYPSCSWYKSAIRQVAVSANHTKMVEWLDSL